jgi:hypothetical protein
VEGDTCSTPALKIELDRLVEFRHRVLGRLRVPRRRSVSPGENRCVARLSIAASSPTANTVTIFARFIDQTRAWLSAETLRSLN